MPIIQVSSNRHNEMIDITSQVAAQIPPDLAAGICHVFSMHTTAGITINENADPDVVTDIESQLDRMVPWKNSNYRHCEGNSAAHIKASLIGFSQSIPVREGRLALGTWQGIYFCEYDGPRQRSVHVVLVS